ncbi:MAG TPA: hypothetical protein VGD99_22020 [Anaerolineae bacterium]|jgi:hypothetical protein
MLCRSRSGTPWRIKQAGWLAGQDETAKRWQAFSRAFGEAKTRLEKILDMPDSGRPADRYLLERMAGELEKASLLSEQPNIEAIAELCAAVF